MTCNQLQCGRNRGIFVKLSKVRRKFRSRDHRSSSRQKRKASLEQRLYHRSLNEKSVESEIAHLKKSKRTDNYYQTGRSTKKMKLNDTQNDIVIKNTRKSFNGASSMKLHFYISHNPVDTQSNIQEIGYQRD